MWIGGVMKGILLVACLWVSFLSTGIAGPAADSRSAQVDALFQPVAGDTLPGAAVVVIQDGTVVYKNAYGMSDVEAKIANTPRTRLLLASVTKLFTATAIMQLQERGLLRIDDPVAKYLPDFPHGHKMTLRHLLSHTGGIPDFVSYEQVGQQPLEFEPGERVSYSNVGYQILGMIIEKVSRKEYGAYLQENIFQPLGMQDSGLDGESLLQARAVGYLYSQNGYQAIGKNDSSGAHAAGGLYSAVEDLVLWNQALDSGRLLKAETLREMITATRLGDGREAPFGLGWMLHSYRGLKHCHHGGDIYGFNSEISRFPDQKLSIVVLANIGMRPPGPLPAAADLAKSIAGIYLAEQMVPEEAAKTVAVDPAILDLYVGEYEIQAPETVLQEGGSYLIITREGNRLMAESKMGRLEIHAEAENVFQAHGSPIKLIFVRGADDGVGEVILSVMGVREFRAFKKNQE
jgi:CubicO group peptidase (beta-lactamase class C family)